MYSCWYKALVGIAPDKSDCKQLHQNGCDGCSFFMPDPPEPGDKNAQDEDACCENCFYATETDIAGLVQCELDGRSKDDDMMCDRWTMD